MPASNRLPERVDAGGKFKASLTPDQEVELMELVSTQHLSHRQAARIWGQRTGTELSHTTVGRIVKRNLERLAEESLSHASAMRAQQRLQIDQLIRSSLPIALGTKCTVCTGEKTVPKDKLDPSLGVQVCPKCEGSGRNEADTTRIQAVNSIRGLLERLAKLYGLDAPAQLDLGGHIAVAPADLAQMDDGELLRGLQEFATGNVEFVDAEIVEVGSADTEADLSDSLLGPGPLDEEPESAPQSDDPS